MGVRNPKTPIIKNIVNAPSICNVKPLTEMNKVKNAKSEQARDRLA
ncbi:hypothetical protein GCM10007140_13460 [Priestia taiwanensis]|uniref:Uncharacterized protein n=1 Tax=Priestia taiwanensis TaxID=1347902 RepID=A0A917API2_9BACI|nr:hypothetical protein GCM10007140_13460 [Priestia taiwanensis]